MTELDCLETQRLTGRATSAVRGAWTAFVAICIVIGLGAGTAGADARSQARRMHDRIVGVPPSATVLSQMETMITAGNGAGAAFLAMENPEFYRVSLKNWVTPWTNEEMTVFAPLNDYTATVIGFIRDDVPFDEILSRDVVYVGAPGVVGPGYSHSDNDHYRALEDQRIDLSDPGMFVPVTQSELPNSQIRASEAAGIITTRQAGRAFFSGGTNRAMLRFTAMNHLCRDIDALSDITRSVDRIRQDVNRSPGGDSEIFHTACVGCHTGMDPMAGAFAYFEWDEDRGRVVHERGEVQEKYLINNNVFPGGYITIDNRWDNYWRSGPKSVLGWRGPNSGGYGAKTMGEEIASSRRFSECQVEKVFERLCFRPAGDAFDRAEVQRVANIFESSDYSMKSVFAEVSTYCMGD